MIEFIRAALLLIGVALISGSVSAGSVASADKLILEKRLHQFLAGATRNDAEVHDAYWAPELIYTSSSGTRFGKAELMKSVREAPPAPDTAPVSYSAVDVDIRVYGESAVVAFVLVADAINSEVDQRYLNTGTFLKRDQQWQAVAWQATKVPAPDDQKTEPESEN